MASIKNLKKDINYTLGDIIGICNLYAHLNPTVDMAKSNAIVDETIETFNGLIAKIHVKNIENKKIHFKAVSVELEEKTNVLIGKVNAL